MSILFYGDPHREWQALFDAIHTNKPEHLVIMGDLELDEPFRVKLAPALDAGVSCYWIAGNHDTHSPQMFEYLWEDYPQGNLGGKVSDLSSSGRTVRVAGLGGHYKGKIWFPKCGPEVPGYPSREEFLRRQGKGGRFKGGIPLGQRATIFPEDHAGLASGVCDILVCHEAPTSVGGDMGFGAIDDLARDMRSGLVIHGHHHTPYDGKTRDGISVRGLGRAEVFYID